MVNAPQADALLRFTASLTKEQKQQFLKLVHLPAFDVHLVPSSVHYLEQMKRYCLCRAQKSHYQLHIREEGKVRHYFFFLLESVLT